MALLRRAKAAQSDFFPGFSEIAEIGIGSLATVYRAREVGTNRLVALKLLNVRDASPRAIESFERESIALGAVIMAALWWFLWRAAAGEKRYRPSRLARLTALALLPLFGFLVIPVGCWVSIRSQAGAIAGWSVFAASTIAFVAFWAYSRYARRRNQSS